MVQSDSTRKKAELISNNTIYIPNNIKLPYPLDRSTAGPESGFLSIAISFDGKNIKLAVSKNQNDVFSLKKEYGKFQILKKGNLFLENIKINPILFHAPGQAFINLDNRCIYDCSFCTLTRQGFLLNYDEEKFLNLILKVSKRSDLQAVAITSGVYPNNSEIIKKMCYITQNVKKKLPDISIGIESCIFSKKEILALKKAGADEIKINLQIPDKDLFKKICPDFDYNNVFNMLKEAVEIFGKGKVTSNIIYGLGESDRAVIKTIEKLAEIDIVPTLRKIRVNEFNRRKLEGALSYKIPETSTTRILKLAQEQKKILEKYGLTTKTFKTMCHKCGCCDIVPFWDL